MFRDILDKIQQQVLIKKYKNNGNDHIFYKYSLSSLSHQIFTTFIFLLVIYLVPNQYNNTLIEQMLKVKFESWGRVDNNHMYDYSTTNDKIIKQLVIGESGIILRHVENYDIIFLTQIKVKIKQGYQQILKIVKTGQNYQIIDINSTNNQFLGKIVTPLVQQGLFQKINTDIIQGDSIKLGKVLITIKKIQRSQQNFYQSTTVSRIANINKQYSLITETGQNSSFIQDCPSCRYCLSKTVQSKANPLYGGLCSCTGSAKYAHQECLVEWINKRSNFIQQKQKRFLRGNLKGFQCQICKSYYPCHLIYPYLTKNPFKEYIIMTIHIPNQQIYFINLGSQQEQQHTDLIKCITIGRNNDCNVVINDLSVSRKHCKIYFNKTNRRLTLVDLNSKFGTLCRCVKDLIHNNSVYQKGRTVLSIQKLQKKSFWGFFCSPSEKSLSYAKEKR